jgi:WhiB family redox-sensing transcriptional regulator
MSVRAPRPSALALGTMPTDWMQLGACREAKGVDFFPSAGSGVLAAQRVCAGCPVRETCLEYALAEEISHGVWGGASDRQRQRLRAARLKGEREARRRAARQPDTMAG